MANVVMWIGIVVILVGFAALSWEAMKRMQAQEELNKFPQKKNAMRVRRNYCLMVIFAGMLLLVLALII